MKKPIFTGAGVAIVTPFTGKDLEINFPLFEEIIENQIANGTDAIIVCGTTGEKSTLVYDEHVEAIRVAVETVGGRIPVIAGTGSNDTVHAVKLSNDAEKMGVDGLLMMVSLNRTHILRSVYLLLLFYIMCPAVQVSLSSLRHILSYLSSHLSMVQRKRVAIFHILLNVWLYVEII